MSPRVLLIDNYDSFTHNLRQALLELSAEVIVHRNDEIDLVAARALRPTHVVLSPGPGRPEVPRDFGLCKHLIDYFEGPLLGICLGHQGIAWRMGGQIVHAPTIMHGKMEMIQVVEGEIFKDLPSRLQVMRYHSLTVDPARLPECLRVTSHTEDGVIMGVQHTERPLYGLQFHPESVGTPEGPAMLRNFLRLGS
ncbi:MAG: aminodeoxychorismate/anthranilate synthase component II [Deltaproteobacteria bacterium]|nr:MAG: aminodeoxychorismate/anthranilate synthase component II [Deltaproteobacteria bacterium]